MSICLLFMACFVGITPILCCVRNISFQGVGGWVGPQFLWGNQNTRPSSSHPVFSRSVRPCLFLIKPFVLGSLSNQTDPIELSPQRDKNNLGTAQVKPFFDRLIFSGRSLSLLWLTTWCVFTFLGAACYDLNAVCFLLAVLRFLVKCSWFMFEGLFARRVQLTWNNKLAVFEKDDSPIGKGQLF